MSINKPNLVHTSESSSGSISNSCPSSGNEDQDYRVQEDKDRKSIQGSEALLMMGADQTFPMKSVQEENDSQDGDNEENYLNPDIEDNERRLAQNRKTAQLRRDRNKDYLESLQIQKNRLGHEHQVLKSENDLLKKHHTTLLSFMVQYKVQEQEQKQQQHKQLQPNQKHQQQQVLQHLVSYQQYLKQSLNGGNTSMFPQTSDSTPLTLNDQQYQQQYQKRTFNFPNNSTDTTALQQQPQQPLLNLQAYQQYQKQLLNNKNDRNNLAACPQQSATTLSASNNQQYHQPCKKQELKVPNCDTRSTTAQLVQQGQEEQHVQQHGQHHQHQPFLNIQSYQNNLRQLLNNNNISTSCIQPQQIASMARIASNDQQHQQDSKKRSLNALDNNKKIQQFRQEQESITLRAKREIQGRQGKFVASTNNITTTSAATNQYPNSTVPSNQSQHPLQDLQHHTLLFNNQQQNLGLQSYLNSLLPLSSSSHSGNGARNQQGPNQIHNNLHNN